MFNFGMKLKDANYKSHWNNLVFYNQWKIKSDLNISHRKMSGFVSFLLFGFTLVIKLRNFENYWIKKVSNDFKIYWNTILKILYLKGYEYLLSQIQQVINHVLVIDRSISKVFLKKSIKVKKRQCSD